MPLLQRIFITAEITEDHLKTLSFELMDMGCVLVKDVAERLGLPEPHVRGMCQGMDGVTCDADRCCVTNVATFAETLRKIKGE